MTSTILPGTIISTSTPNNPVTGSISINSTTGAAQVYANNQWANITGGGMYSINTPKSSLHSSTGKSITIDELLDFVEVMKKRMLVIMPNFEKHEQYEALKQAYEHYLVLDRLINESHKPD